MQTQRKRRIQLCSKIRLRDCTVLYHHVKLLLILKRKNTCFFFPYLFLCYIQSPILNKKGLYYYIIIPEFKCSCYLTTNLLNFRIFKKYLFLYEISFILQFKGPLQSMKFSTVAINPSLLYQIKII